MIFGLTEILTIAGFIVTALFTIGLILAKLYKRASKEISFVRTGFGGQKVIMDGGALVFPVLHEIIPVNMNTLRLEVRRDREQALITRDRMRVDVVAEFYVRVQPTMDSISNAAQTLGNRTMEREELKELVEGKFVDALRSVAAEMSMTELHEKRIDFVQKVQQAVTEDLLKNGLELEAVSLTGLDQTSKEYFNPNNAFDAEGLTRLTEEIEHRRKVRNDIEQDTEVEMKNKNLEAERKKIEIIREEENAKLEQNREIEVKRASQTALIAKEKAAKEKEAEQAQIIAKKEVEESKIEADKVVEEARIQKERIIETENIEKEKQVELAQQVKDIAIAQKSKAQSEAQAEADKARAVSALAEEQVLTVREKEVAERQKQIELIEAAKQAERDAIAITIAAETEKKAANDKACALKIEAEAKSEKTRIMAAGEAEAEKVKAAASKVRYTVEAEGKKALNEAANLLSNDQISMQLKIKLLENLEGVIRESVRPMEKIDGIKIFQVGGLAGGDLANASNSVHANGNLSDQVVNSALKYRAQAPLLDSLLKEIGIDGGNINGIGEALNKISESSSKKIDEDNQSQKIQ